MNKTLLALGGISALGIGVYAYMHRHRTQTLTITPGDNQFTCTVTDSLTVKDRFGPYSWFAIIYRLESNSWIPMASDEFLQKGHTYFLRNYSDNTYYITIG